VTVDVARTSPVRVLLVEDHAVVREALTAMLSFEDDIEIVATTASGTEAVELAAELQPHVVLMDVALQGLNGIEATRRISASMPDVRVIVLSMHDDDETVLRAVSEGAVGFLPKNTSRANLLQAVRTVGAGHAYLDGQVTGAFLRRVAPVAGQVLLGERLTAREQEVLELLAEGLSAKEIASRLVVGEQTVKTHLNRLYQKLGVNDRVQAVVLAIRRGLVP